ncbi:hypothetical protein ACEPAG_4744 [Sanghuangporus baumii]
MKFKPSSQEEDVAENRACLILEQDRSEKRCKHAIVGRPIDADSSSDWSELLLVEIKIVRLPISWDGVGSFASLNTFPSTDRSHLRFSSILWGAGCIQLYFYYEKFWKSDQVWLKTYVLLTWTLDVVHQALIIQVNYAFFVSSIENSSLLAHLPRSIPINGFIIAIIDSMVQLFFVRKVWYLSDRNRILTAILLVAVLAQFVLTIAYCGQIYNIALMTQLSQKVHFELAMNCTAAFTDTFLAVSMMCLIRKARSGIHRTDSLINRLVVYTVASGFVIAFWALVALIGAATAPHSLIYLSADLCFPKLYFNCMLALLNARLSLRERLNNEIVEMSFRVENLHSAPTAASIGDASSKVLNPKAPGGTELTCDEPIV